MYYPRLRDLREDHDLTQKEVAAALGIDQRVYSTYETGRREIPAHHAVALADFYKTSTDYLFGRTDQSKPYRGNEPPQERLRRHFLSAYVPDGVLLHSSRLLYFNLFQVEMQ